MKPIKIDLGRELEYIKIDPLADLHVGDKFCDIKLINKRLDEIKEDKNKFVILNGDLINNATKTSVSDIYSEILTPMEQLQTATKLFEPIKDKILAITQGNHEFRSYKKEGIDLSYLLASQLKIEDRYSAEGAFLFVRFGELSRGAKESNGSGKIRKACYTIYSTHGQGGGRKEGAKAIRLADMACVVDADIYIHSHTHLPMIMRQSYFRVDAPNSFVSQVDKLFVNTGASLNYGGYGQVAGFKPSTKESPIIYLNGNRKEFRATL